MRLAYFGANGETEVFETAAPHLTIGSGVACNLRLGGLAPLECTVYLSEQGYYATDDGGRLSIGGVRGPGFLRPGQVLQIGDTLAFRFDVLPDAAPPEALLQRAPVPSAPRRTSAVRAASAARVSGGSARSPAAAAALSALVPGAGQAYNGQPVRAFLFLVSSALVAPWLLGIWDAHRVAASLGAEGVPSGGGFSGVLLHLWLLADLALLLLLALTLKGVLT